MTDAYRRFAEVDALLARALDLEADERRGFLERACEGDEALREAALRLLEAADRPGPLDGRDNAALAAALAVAAAAESGGRGDAGALPIGSTFGPYRVLAPVGAGGMGEVYRARDSRLEREVALKVLPSEFADDADHLLRLEREARLLATLNHAHINTIHELEEAEGRKALVLELVEGETLAERLAEGPLPVEQALEVARQVADALAAAHGRGVLHRDLKPANIKITPEGRAKVLDFGLARPLATARADPHSGDGPVDTAEVTRPDRIVGTGPYMSPEQWRGARPDERSDLWALGCVLFEMLTGKRAFAGPTAADTGAAVLERQPDWSALPRALPRSVLELLRRCLRKEPQKRPASAREVREVLDRCLAGLASKPSVATTAGRLAAVLAAGLALAALIWAGAGFVENRPRPTAPIDSIAVLPFENIGDDPEGEYLSDGLTDRLINSLSKLHGLRVVPRGIASGYGSENPDLEAVAAALEVRALVTGRVAERDGEVTVGVELTDAEDRSQLWGERYVHSADDLLTLEEMLVRSILDELLIELTPEQQRRVLDPATRDPEAYRLYLKANYHTFRTTPEGLDKGLEYARQAIELDPGFALAYVALSQSHMTRGFLGLEPWESAGLKSRAATRRAIELDDTLAAAHVEVGYLKHHFDWDWAGAERAFRRALELDPDHAEAHQGLSESLLSLGRTHEALAAGLRAVELDPFNPTMRSWLAFCQLGAGRYADAERSSRAALELEPSHSLDHYPDSLLLDGRERQAVEALFEALVAAGEDPERSPGLAAFHAWSGNEAAARKILARIGDGGRLQPFARSDLALTLALLGETDRAFDILDRMLAERSRGLLWLHARPMWEPVRSEPRFRRIVRSMGLPLT